MKLVFVGFRVGVGVFLSLVVNWLVKMFLDKLGVMDVMLKHTKIIRILSNSLKEVF